MKIMLYYHPGPLKREMEKITKKCHNKGPQDVSWRGYYPQEIIFEGAGAALEMKYANLAGCISRDRNCGRCSMRKECPAILKEPWGLDIWKKI